MSTDDHQEQEIEPHRNTATIPPVDVEEEGDLVRISFTATWGTPSTVVPQGSPAAVPVSIHRPGRFLDREKAWFLVAPDRAVEVLSYAIHQLCGPVTRLHLCPVIDSDAAHLIVKSLWFLDNYWPYLSRAIGRMMKLAQWPPSLNPEHRMLEGTLADTQYLSLGMETVDAVREAMMCGHHSPWLHSRDTQGRPQDVAAQVYELIPAALERLRLLGSISTQAERKWWRGLEQEQRYVQNALRAANGANRQQQEPADAEQTPPSARRRGGRPKDTDEKLDARMFDAWQTGTYKTLEQLGNAFATKKEEAERALQRHQGRLRAAKKKQQS